MSKKNLKRRATDHGESSPTASPKKRAVLVNDDSEQVVKEFVKLVNVKETRLKGLIKFNKALKAVEERSKCEIILTYLKNHPDCVELFKVLEDRIEERSLLEVQLVLEILETIILRLAEEDMRAKSKSTAITSIFLNKHRKLVYNLLSSSSSAKVVTAMLKLLTAIVMQGSIIAKELLTTFDFSHKTFCTLANRRDKKDIGDVRSGFIKFLLAFFVSGEPSLIQQVIQIKGFATSIFKNLYMDLPEVIHLVLSTLLVQIVQNAAILKKTKILLFTSYSLTQLVKLYHYDKDNISGHQLTVQDQVHNFLLELCTSSTGIAFENKLGIFSARSNNPVLLRFLNSLPKTLGNNFLIELVIKILINSPDLITPYLLDCQMALEPRNSQQWMKNFSFLTKLYVLLPMPSTVIKASSIIPENTTVSKFIALVCPLTIKRNILTKGLLHSDVLVQTTTLEMMNVILKRSVDLMKCPIMKKMTIFVENLLKVLPSLQTLISIRESVLNKTKMITRMREATGDQTTEQDSPKISTEDAKILLSQTLLAIKFFHILWPVALTQTGYDLWKILPKNDEEEKLYNFSSQHSMLQVLLNSLPGHFKWQLQTRSGSFQGLFQVLHLYCSSENVKIKSLSGEAIQRLFLATGVFDGNEKELNIWLRNLLDDCVGGHQSVIKFLEKVYNSLVNNPCDFVDVVLDCVHSNEETDYLTPSKNVDIKAMPFSPLIAVSLKLFGEMLNSDQQEKDAIDKDFITRFLNLVVLELLTHQSDPRPLYYIITKYLTHDEVVTRSLPAQTQIVINYIAQWCPESKDTGLVKEQGLSPRKGSLDKANVLKQLKKQRRNLPDDISSVVNFLKFTPVSLLGDHIILDVSPPTDFVTVVNQLPCSLLIQQLQIFLSNVWDQETEITDMAAFQQLSTALLTSVKNNNIKHWDRIIASCMFLIRCLVQLHYQNSENKITFTKVSRIITEVLRIIFHRVWEHKKSTEKPESPSISCKRVQDGGSNDVTSDLDDVSETVANQEDVFLEILRMVFGHFVFRDWFCCHISERTNKLFSVTYISSVVTDCVVKLIIDLKSQILTYNELDFWKPYFIGIAQAVKAEDTDQITDTILPFNLRVSSLVEIFCNRFTVTTLREMVLGFLGRPKKQLIKTLTVVGEENENILTEKGRTLINLLDCFLSKGGACLEICSTEELEQTFNILTCVDCQETDELIAKYISLFTSVSDQINHLVIERSLGQPSRMRVETLLILLSSKPCHRRQFEEYLVNCRKERKGQTASFLENASQWELILPLLNFYLASVIKDDSTGTKTTRKCLKCINKVSWSKLTEILLGENSPKCSKQHVQLTLHLLEIHDSDSDSDETLFYDAIKQEDLVHCNTYQLQMIEALLQFLLKHSSNEKDQMKYRTSFVFACLQKITNTKLEGQEPLRLNLLSYLENHGKGPLKLKAKDHFTTKEFVNVTNTFIKSALRSHFSCPQTLRVVGVIIKTVYTKSSSQNDPLLPLTVLYQFILSHSKFLEIFLSNYDEKNDSRESKSALIDLLQTVIDLDPKCCHPSHVSLILGAYNAKLHLIDQKLLCLLFSYEAALGELNVGSQLLWGEAAIEAYEASKKDSSKLFHQPNISQVLELLDSKLLLQSAKHFPIHRELKPVVFSYSDDNGQRYDPCFLLPLFSFLMTSNFEVDCKRFVDRSGLAYTISALTSMNEQIRQVAYQILSRFLVHLSASRFREKQQVIHLLHCFQNGILQPNTRISSLVVSFITRALHIFFYPEDPLYVSVNSYMLQKAFFDLRDVPLFLSLINSTGLGYRTERIWLFHLLLDGLRDSLDYYCCKKYHVFQQLFSLYNCSIADKHLQNLILKVIRLASSLRDPVYDLCQNYGLVPWLHMLVSGSRVQRDTLAIVLDILATLWFTLIGQEVSSDQNDVSTSGNPLPKNISSELGLVCLTVLERYTSLDVWDQESFLCFVRLLASLLGHQNNIAGQPRIDITKKDALKITRLWKSLFYDPNIVRKLISLFNLEQGPSNEVISSFSHKVTPSLPSGVTSSLNNGVRSSLSSEVTSSISNEMTSSLPSKVTSSKWFSCMVSVVRILKSLSEEEISEDNQKELLLYSCIPKPLGKCVEVFLEGKLRLVLEPLLVPEEVERCADGDGLWEILRSFNFVK